MNIQNTQTLKNWKQVVDVDKNQNPEYTSAYFSGYIQGIQDGFKTKVEELIKRFAAKRRKGF